MKPASARRISSHADGDGTRPRAPRDQRTGAICPAKGKGAGLVMPWCDTDVISAAVDPGAHAVLIVDQAGWHLTPKLMTTASLPPRSPELNPVELAFDRTGEGGPTTVRCSTASRAFRFAAMPDATSAM